MKAKFNLLGGSTFKEFLRNTESSEIEKKNPTIIKDWF